MRSHEGVSAIGTVQGRPGETVPVATIRGGNLQSPEAVEALHQDCHGSLLLPHQLKDSRVPNLNHDRSLRLPLRQDLRDLAQNQRHPQHDLLSHIAAPHPAQLAGGRGGQEGEYAVADRRGRPQGTHPAQLLHQQSLFSYPDYN